MLLIGKMRNENCLCWTWHCGVYSWFGSEQFLQGGGGWDLGNSLRFYPKPWQDPGSFLHLYNNLTLTFFNLFLTSWAPKHVGYLIPASHSGLCSHPALFYLRNAITHFDHSLLGTLYPQPLYSPIRPFLGALPSLCNLDYVTDHLKPPWPGLGSCSTHGV